MFVFAFAAAAAAAEPSVADLHVICPSRAGLDHEGPMGRFIQQITDHLPTGGRTEVWGSRAERGSDLRVEATLTDPAGFPAWLDSYGYAAKGPGRWVSATGATVTLADGHVVLTRHDAGTLMAPTPRLPKMGEPAAGCSMSFHMEKSMATTPVGVLVDFYDPNTATMRMALPGPPTLWKGKRASGPPVLKTSLKAEGWVRVNLEDVAAFLRAFSTTGPKDGAFDEAWLALAADHLAPGAEMAFEKRELVAAFPLRGVTATQVLAKVGEVGEDGVVELQGKAKKPSFLTNSGKLLVLASSRALAVEAHQGGGEPVFSSDRAWRAPGVHIYMADGRKKPAHLDLVAMGDDLVVAARSEGLAELAGRFLPSRSTYARRTAGTDPVWPIGVPREADENKCETRFTLDGAGAVENLAVWGCEPPFARAVRAAAATWRYSDTERPPLLSVRERTETVHIAPPAAPLRDAPPRAKVTAYATTPSGLDWADITVGTGVVPAAGQEVVIEWSAWRADGVPAGSTYEQEKPLTFRLGEGWGLPAWEETIATMRVGGRRQIVAPPDLAYGSEGVPPRVPPHATITFDIALLAVDPPHEPAPAAGLGALGIGGLIGGRTVPRRGIQGPATSPPRPPDTTVTLADPTITGALGSDVVAGVVKRHLNQIRYCYQRELIKVPTLAGALTADVEIAPTGEVTSAAAPAAAKPFETVSKCVEGRFLRMQFPAGDGTTRVQYPMTFAPPPP